MIGTHSTLQFAVPLFAAQVVVPAICAGILFTGFILYLFIYLQTRQNLFLSILLFCVAAFIFTASEISILVFGVILDNLSLGRQIHRIQQLSGLFFIPIIPLLLNSLPDRGERARKAGRVLLYFGAGVCLTVTVLSFVLPDLYISQLIPKADWLIRETSYARGAEGILYTIRDAILAIYILYMLFILIYDMGKNKSAAMLMPILIGLLIAVAGALNDVLNVYTGREIILPSAHFPRFPIGVTLFILLAMSSIMRDYIQKTKDMEKANLALSQREEELIFLAYHDQLTSLHNRKSFYERFEEIITQAKRFTSENNRALLFIDLDNFKDVNDSMGHDAGDSVLKLVGGRLSETIRKSDLLFRIGGDEFTIILSKIETEFDAAIVAQKIYERFTESFTIMERPVYMDMSIGIAVYPKDGQTVEDLVKNADTALYEAKKQKNTYHYFTEDLQRIVVEKLKFNTYLREAADTRNFSLEFQPQMTTCGVIRGAEALLRWDHPVLGRVSPCKFIPIAEETGLIVSIGEWVAEEAARLSKTWLSSNIDIPVSVNISARHLLDKNFLPFIEKMLAAGNIDPGRFILEITESSFITDYEGIRQKLAVLVSEGIHIHIDDFGTGYSSLQYLKKLPVHAIKIDKSFIDELPGNRSDVSLVESVIGISRSLGLEVVAEGVERKDQLSILESLGCSLIQGYYFSKPLPSPDFLLFAGKCEKGRSNL